MVRCLAILATAIIFSGCCTVPAHVPFECPERPMFSEYSEALWNTVPMAAQENIVKDDLSMKEYILACEAAAKIHN